MVDVGFWAWSAKDLYDDPSWSNAGWLALDTVSLIPLVPSAGWVRRGAQAINYAEILSRTGLYGWAPKLPYILGMEAYGEIDVVGPGVEHRHVGERVIVGTQYGSYAESIVVPEPQAQPAIGLAIASATRGSRFMDFSFGLLGWGKMYSVKPSA